MEFERLEILIGKDNLNKLKETKVLIVGLGGVGGYAIEALARSGIGTIILVDYDTIDITNLNRQIIALHSTIGMNKTDVFEKRIKDINPDCKVIKYNIFYDENNSENIFNLKPDYVIDACDSILSKELLIKESLKRDIKIITSMGAGKRIDSSKVEFTTIDKTSYDPLAKKLRKYLKDNEIKIKIPCIYSKEIPSQRIDSKDIGSIIFVPATAGLLLANYVVKDIIK